MRHYGKYLLLLGLVAGGCGKANVAQSINEDIVEVTPEIVTTEAEAATNSVLIKALVDRTDGITGYGFYFGKGNEAKKVPANNLAEGHFSCRVIDLEPETTYLFRAFISNGVSEILSSEKSITTLPQPKPTDIIDIPDTVFREYLLWYFDADKDGFLTWEEGRQIKIIEIENNEIASIKGVEHFPNLEKLAVNGVQNGEIGPSDGKLTQVDLSGNPKLRELHFEYQNIEELDLCANPELIHFGMFKNPIRKIDISSNTKLRLFGTGFCQLDSIDLTHNINADEVHLDSNKLQKINIGTNHNLRYLDVRGNLLRKVDISGCDHLQEFYCTGNPQLDTIFVKTGQVFTKIEYDPAAVLVAKD